MTNEQTRQLIAGLNQERAGYETRLRAAEDAGDTERVEALKHRIAQVDRQIKVAGGKKQKAKEEPSGPGPAPAEEEGTFDPAAHTVDEVLAYVADHPDQRETVLTSEDAGKARKTLLEALTESEE